MLSIIAVFHNMQREARRTLHSLSPGYQRNVAANDYEVIAIDNGSKRPLDRVWAESTGPAVRYHYLETESVSPVDAVNLGASMAHGDDVAIIVDGARMASPGLIHASIRGLRLYDDPAVCALSWHLGPDVQNRSLLEGYNQTREDELLDSIAWPSDGYRLFEISTLAPSSGRGFLGGMPGEFSWISLRRNTFLEIGGFHAGFQSPGGGLVNQHFRNRLMVREGIMPMLLLGEGVFHQFHGGVATNVPRDRHPMPGFREEYQNIVGEPWEPRATPEVLYFGSMPAAARKFINRA